MKCHVDQDGRWFLLGYALVLPALLAPLFVTPILPGLDFPFHLAIADMVGKSGDVASPYADFYAPRTWPPLPALPWLLLSLLGKCVGPLVALKLLVGLSIALLPLTVAALARAWGVAASPALVAAPLGYHLGLHYGFFGYSLSLPIVFAVLAIAARVQVETVETVETNEKLRRLGGALLLGFSLLLLFGLHLESYALAMTMVVAMALFGRGALRCRVLVLLALVPSVVLFLLWLSRPQAPEAGAASRSLVATFSDLIATRRGERGNLSFVGDLAAHGAGLRVHLLRGFRDGADLAGSTLVLSSWVALALMSRLAPFRASADHPLANARPAALAVALLAYLSLPHHWPAYEAMSLSPRLSPIVVAVAIASLPIRPDWLRASGTLRTLARTLLAVPVVVGTGYAAVVSREYSRYGREVADFVSVLSRVPPGGRLVGLVSDGESRVMNVESLARALPSLYVALHPHPRSMVALRYCGMGHVPCALRATPVPAPNPWTPAAIDAERAMDFFDYALVQRSTTSDTNPFFGHAETVAEQGSWIAYRLRHGR